MIEDLKKAKTAELEAELELYRSMGDVQVASADELTNNAKRVEEIERLQKEHGFPLVVTEEFLTENPAIADIMNDNGVKVGDTVMLSQDDLDAETKRRTKVALVGKASALVEDNAEKPAFVESLDAMSVEELETLIPKMEAELERNKDGGGGTPPARGGNRGGASPVGDDVERVYGGKTVTKVENRILHGKSYRDVTVSTGETFTITVEEFEDKVKPRQVL